MAKKLTFTKLNALAKLSTKPLEDKKLEKLQAKYFGKFRHHYYRFLYHLVLEQKPKLVLEIGIGWETLGITHMAAAAETYGGYALGIDLVEPRDDNAAEYDNYHFLKIDSTKARKKVLEMVEAFGPLGIVFQDSSHHYDQSVKEWSNFVDLMGKNSVWVCDDITDKFFRPGIDEQPMTGYFDDLLGHKKKYTELHEGTVMGVVLL